MSVPAESDLELAARLVREAGALAAKMRADGVTREFKTSVSDVVTAADRAAEQLILDGLVQARPDDGIVGEEGADRASVSGRQWIIDPVDGTYNFVSGLTWWCSALALVDGDELILGAIYHPADDALYLGGPQIESTRNGVPIGQMPDVALANACVTTYLHPPALGSEIGEAFTRAVSNAAALRMLGSGSMDMAAIAQGMVHLYCQHSVPPWDRLPGQAIVLGAGGVARQVEAGGKTWSLIGAPKAVAEAASALAGD